MSRSIRIAVLFVMASVSGCATRIHRPARAPQPTKARLGQYPRVELVVPIGIGEGFAGRGANEKARAKIEEHLVGQLSSLFPTLVQVSHGEKGPPALRIEPVVEEIKFVGGAGRFWAGGMAGSSAVLMQVTYTDTATGEVLGNPEFYRSSNAFGGAWTMGATDNLMLEQIATEITNYSALNR